MRSIRKHVIKRVMIGASVMIAVMAYGIRLYDIRTRFPDKTIEECREGEKIAYCPRIEHIIDADTELSPGNITVYTGTEFLEKYPNMRNTYANMSKFDTYYMIVPEIYITNLGNEVVSIEQLTMYFTFTSPYNGYANGIRILNAGNIEPGETKTMEAAVLVNSEYIGKENLETYLKSDFYMLVSAYPIEKRLVYEKK